MANQILLKRSAVPNKVPVVSDLGAGELALNTADAKVYMGTGTQVKRILTTDDLSRLFGSSTAVTTLEPVPTDQFGTYVLGSFSTSVFRTLKLVAQITQGTNFESVELFCIHNGVDAQITEYARVTMGSTGVTFGAQVSGGEMSVTCTQPAVATVIKAFVIAILV